VGSVNGGSSLGVIAVLSTLLGDCTGLLKWLGNWSGPGKGEPDFLELRHDRGCERNGKSGSNDRSFCVFPSREGKRSDNLDSLDNSPSLFFPPPSSSSVG